MLPELPTLCTLLRSSNGSETWVLLACRLIPPKQPETLLLACRELSMASHHLHGEAPALHPAHRPCRTRPCPLVLVDLHHHPKTTRSLKTGATSSFLCVPVTEHLPNTHGHCQCWWQQWTTWSVSHLRCSWLEPNPVDFSSHL